MEKQRWEESEKRREEERRSEKRKSQRKEDAGARKGRKVAKHCVGSGRSKSRLAKAAGCGAVWGDERWKITRHSGAKHISKSKCRKHGTFGAHLEVAMSKKRTQLWREAHFHVETLKAPHARTTFGIELLEKSARLCGAKHFQGKRCKTPQCRSAFGSWDVEKVHAVVAGSTSPSQNVKSTTCSDHFWTFSCRFAGARDGAPCPKWAKREGIVAVSKHFAWQAQYKKPC